MQLNEPYRTILGHFRHEVGHYYWDRFFADEENAAALRSVFGDEREDYAEALKRHYETGAPVLWQGRFHLVLRNDPSLGGLGGNLGALSSHGRRIGNGGLDWPVSGASRGERTLSGIVRSPGRSRLTRWWKAGFPLPTCSTILTAGSDSRMVTPSSFQTLS